VCLRTDGMVPPGPTKDGSPSAYARLDSLRGELVALLVNLGAVNAHVSGGNDANAYLVAADGCDGDPDRAVDDDFFAHFAAEDQHEFSSLRV
jgi:hypothetical protein